MGVPHVISYSVGQRPAAMFLLFITLALAAAASAANEPLLALGDNRGNLVWSDLGSVARYEISVFEANIPSSKWKILAHHGQDNWDNLKQPIHAFQDRTANKDALATPDNFTQIWNCNGDTTWTKGSFWRIECPAGFVAVGDIAIASNSLTVVPKEWFEKVRCVNEALTEDCKDWNVKLWDNDNSIARKDASVWTPEAGKAGFTEWFFAHTKHNERPPLSPKCLKKSSFEIL